MANPTIKHFIFTRFFPFQDPKFPHNIFDVAFLKSQLPLTRNILGSLENQTNKNFELFFRLHEKFFSNEKYKFIFATLQDSTTLPLKFVKTKEIHALVEEAFNNYDFVIQSRMDFDDFIFKDAIADTQSKVKECDNILGYGYCKGYAYTHGDLRSYFQKWGGKGHPMIMQSLILKSSFAKTLPYIDVLKIQHVKVKVNIKEFLNKNGIDFSENMFQQNTSTDALIYYRHDGSHYNLVNSHGVSIEERFKNRAIIPQGTITKKQLEEEFGFFHELNSIK